MRSTQRLNSGILFYLLFNGLFKISVYACMRDQSKINNLLIIYRLYKLE